MSRQCRELDDEAARQREVAGQVAGRSRARCRRGRARGPRRGDERLLFLQRGDQLVVVVGGSASAYEYPYPDAEREQHEEQREQRPAQDAAFGTPSWRTGAPAPGGGGEVARGGVARMALAGAAAHAITLFTTGIAPNGLPPGPPMPGFRFSKGDAAAVVAYLRSLKSPARAK